MTDKNLQVRVGLNVGNEPSMGNFIDKAGQTHVVMTGNAEVTLFEGIEENGRTALANSVLGHPVFGAFNSDVGNVGSQSRFYNAFGESIAANVEAVIPGVSIITLNMLSTLGTQPLVLVAGEKFTVKRVVSVPNPGTAAVDIFTSYRDLKIKPKPRGGGGLTDGNVARVRATITAQGVDIQPPPGKAWAPVAYGEEQVTWDVVGHFGALGDNPAVIEMYLIDENNVVRFMEASSPIDPQQIVQINNYFNANMLLANPFKIRYKLVGVNQKPLPAGRVMLLSAYTEYDQPR